MAKRKKSELQQRLETFDKRMEGKTLTPKEEETREELVSQIAAETFKKLAEIRGNRALRAILGLQMLANPGKYVYTPKQIDTLKDAFKQQLESCFAAFDGKSTAKKGLTL